MLTDIANAILPDSAFLCFCLGFLAFLYALMAYLYFFEKRRRQIERPPQSEKLLRPPGYSLGIRLEATIERLIGSFFVAATLCGLAAGLLKSAFVLSATKLPLGWSAASGIAALSSLAACVFFTQRLFRQLTELRNLKLGLRGEQAVAEALHQLAEHGYRAFHDLPGGDNWNIDHILVGRQGVFLIETKARRKRRANGSQPSHVVRVDDTALQFPSGHDRKAIPQATQNARWLANYLANKTGETVEVEPFVVLPGWFVENLNPKAAKVKVMNCAYLAGFLQSQPDRLDPPQVRRIITALDEKCRDVEF